MNTCDHTESYDKPKISAIIPVFNCEDFFEPCLRSIFSQTEQRVEIIIVDDASTDGSMKMAEKLCAQCPDGMTMRVIHHEKTKGVSAGRNTGVQDAKGEYLFFIDSDDWLAPCCMEELLKLAEEHEADVSCGSFEFYYEDGSDGGRKDGLLPCCVYASGESLMEDYCKRKIPSFLWNKLIRRSYWDDAGLRCEESMTSDEDQLWGFKAVASARRWVCTDTVTYYYSKSNSKSITATSSIRRRLSNYYRVLDFMSDKVVSMNTESVKKQRLLAQALYNFTKSILWHLELESGMDRKMLYAEFRKRHILNASHGCFRHLQPKAKLLAVAWSLPYPLNRCCSPYFIVKQKQHLTALLSK